MSQIQKHPVLPGANILHPGPNNWWFVNLAKFRKKNLNILHQLKGEHLKEPERVFSFLGWPFQ